MFEAEGGAQIQGSLDRGYSGEDRGMAGCSEMGKLPEKSNFFLTCNLFSHYIKEKGCSADIGFGMLPRAFDRSAIGVFSFSVRFLVDGYGFRLCGNFLPVNKRHVVLRDDHEIAPDLDFAGDENAGVNDDAVAPSSKSSPEKSQLTISLRRESFGSREFPAEKAEALMLLASNLQKLSFSPPTATADQPISLLRSILRRTFRRCLSPNFPVVAAPKMFIRYLDLPIARKASLHRFLEKRKERITGKSPYQMSISEGANGSVFAKQEDKSRQSWLGLGPRSLNSSV
ncbi:Protein TIFY 10B [Platanthera guangdongensis]|uniref:Protein TIFY n=1 Tax=Platanthera guangdongensis TaxID=2320717 RepID=A0ABR2N5N7_9ASPA